MQPLRRERPAPTAWRRLPVRLDRHTPETRVLAYGLLLCAMLPRRHAPPSSSRCNPTRAESIPTSHYLARRSHRCGHCHPMNPALSSPQLLYPLPLCLVVAGDRRALETVPAPTPAMNAISHPASALPSSPRYAASSAASSVSPV
uniref:Uncharacterized protein n=1 Tax=uncultured marine virus TaxID=186617 RepID=A0A0F7L535_9VIRU|nr:hypothetical protein [uncultured marine virus]